MKSLFSVDSIFPTSPPALPLAARMRSFSSLTGKGVVIALIDSGFIPHPDLTLPNNRIIAYYDAVADMENDLPPNDVEVSSWHGTMTACTAAGNGYLSSMHYSSLTPNASLILIRTMHASGVISTPTIVKALQWCKKNKEKFGLQIVNLSVYADEIDHSLSHPVIAAVEELTETGVVVVAAAGNNAHAPLRPPASAPSAIAVGGLDDKNSLNRDDDGLYQTTFGKTVFNQIKPEIVAPAMWLAAPILPGTSVHREAAALCAMEAMTNDMLEKVFPLLIADTHLPLQLIRNVGNHTVLRKHIRDRMTKENIISPHYKFVDGTSFAAPIVCSAIALCLELFPELTPEAIKELLISTAKPLLNYPKEPQGYGVLQLEKLLDETKKMRDEEELKRL